MRDVDTAHCGHRLSVVSLLSVDRVRKSASPTQQVLWHSRIRTAASCTPLAWCGAQCEDELCMRMGKWSFLSLTCGHNGEFEANPPCAGWMTVSRMRQRVHWAPICNSVPLPLGFVWLHLALMAGEAVRTHDSLAEELTPLFAAHTCGPELFG